MVFKGASGKAAVIRAVTYDLLFNNMKSIVTKTASKHVDRASEMRGDEGVTVTVAVEGSEREGGDNRRIIERIRKKGVWRGVTKVPLHKQLTSSHPICHSQTYNIHTSLTTHSHT